MSSCPRQEVLNYFDAILRVYNRFGRRDNIYKARIKILVKEMTPAGLRRPRRGRMGALCKAARRPCRTRKSQRLASFFEPPPY